MIGLGPKLSRRAKEPKLWTYEELCEKVSESNQPMELWNGEIIMPPSPDPAHQDSTFDFAQFLSNWVRSHDLGRDYVAPLDMVLSPRQMTQPDVMFISKKRLYIIQKRIMGAADLVVEVVSPGSHDRDRIKKRDLYEQHRVKEYWLVDRIAGTIEVLFLTEGQYKLVGRWRSGQIARSKLLRGFTVAVSDILRTL
jgi:Uma2 family endonuclease